jgi:GT2 family glycosyltransferase
VTPHPSASARISIVVLTHNRRGRVLATLQHLVALPEHCPILVVDNGSVDGSADAIATAFPDVEVLRLPANLGAAGRNAGVQALGAPYIAFCDDDTWWAPGSLARAAALLDRHRDVAVLSARVLIGNDGRLDPTCRAMARSPLLRPALPGPVLLGFLAGACVVRREAFLAVGGYERRLFLGAEEALLTLDLAVRGWLVIYAAELCVHHHPAPRADSRERERRLARNALWVTWLRRPLPRAMRETARILREHRRMAVPVLWAALRGAYWVCRERRPLPPRVEQMRRAIDRRSQENQRDREA